MVPSAKTRGPKFIITTVLKLAEPARADGAWTRAWFPNEHRWDTWSRGVNIVEIVIIGILV